MKSNKSAGNGKATAGRDHARFKKALEVYTQVSGDFLAKPSSVVPALLNLCRADGRKVDEVRPGIEANVQCRCGKHNHGNRNPSIRVTAKTDRVLIHGMSCGLKMVEFCEQLGISPGSLFMDKEDENKKNRKVKDPFKSGVAGAVKGEDGKTNLYPNRKAAVTVYNSSFGRQGDEVYYYPSSKNPQIVVVRWNALCNDDGDVTAKKEIRPISKIGTQWALKWPGEDDGPRPLMDEPSLDGAKLIVVAEGEKAANVFNELGYAATTSSGGSKQADASDWSAVADSGAELVVVSPDSDEPGEKYATAVRTNVWAKNPFLKVATILLPDIQEGEDIADFVDVRRGRGKSDEAIREEIDAIIASVPHERPTRPRPTVLPAEEYPSDAWPKAMADVITRAAESHGSSPEYVGTPVLSVAATAIGITRKLKLKEGYYVPAIIHTAVISPSGTAKSPGQSVAATPLTRHHDEMKTVNSVIISEFKAADREYKAAIKKWDSESGEPRPKKPVQKPLVRPLTTEVTIEGLAKLISIAPRGTLAKFDELKVFFAGHDEYKSGSTNGDASRWNALYNGDSFQVDRRNTDNSLEVPNSAISVTGAVQPAIFKLCIDGENTDNGLAARFMLTRTDGMVSPGDRFGMPSDVIERYVTVIRCLLTSLHSPERGDPWVVMTMSNAAGDVWWKYHCHTKELINERDEKDPIRHAYGKMGDQCGRIAMIIHLCRAAAGEDVGQDVVDVDSMTSALRLMGFHQREAERVYGEAETGEEDLARAKLVKVIEELNAGPTLATVRDVHRAMHRQYKTAEEAEEALRDLVREGYGALRNRPREPGQAGRPTMEFLLFPLPEDDDEVPF